jgi:hypothetical protein
LELAQQSRQRSNRCAALGSTQLGQEETAISTRLRLGDLLIRARLVTEAQVAEAARRVMTLGGRLGDNLVAMGAIDEATLESFLHRIPQEPSEIKDIGIDEIDLMGLLLKLIYRDRLETTRQFVEAIKLPYHIVIDLIQMALGRNLLQTLGSRQADNPIDLSYSFTDEGRRWTIDALNRLRYTGPAPVTLDEFNDQVNMQKLTNEIVSFDRIRKSVGDLTFDDSIIEQCGPALNSGRAMLLYGPPGNGKTSVAHCFANVFNDVIYVPYAIMVEGQIIRVFDPQIHHSLSMTDVEQEDPSSIFRREAFDARWVPCKRPFVVTGGELTLDMLDLRYDEVGNFYEAPLHVKALGGCFIIDDFGRQLVSPTNLLNRWIVPLENRVDYLKLHTGKTFSVPFEEMIIFSTNLEPEDLMDPAFLRRLPYKIEIGSPSYENYRKIFEKEAARQGMILSSSALEYIVHVLKFEKELDFAAYQPKFIVDQVVATCKFMGQPPHFEPRYVDYALDNLRVKRSSDGRRENRTSARIADAEPVGAR